MSTFTFYPNGPSISTLYCVCPKCSGHNDDVRCEKDFSKCEKYTPSLHSAREKRFTAKLINCHPHAQRSTKCSASVVKRRWRGSCKFAVMYSNTMAVSIFLNIQWKPAHHVSTFEVLMHLDVSSGWTIASHSSGIHYTIKISATLTVHICQSDFGIWRK